MSEEVKKEEALRFNTNKIDMTLMPEEVKAAFSTVTMRNSQKYGGKYPDKNYLKGAPQSQYMECLSRHFSQHMSGEKIDPTDGLPHLWKMLWNVSMAVKMSVSRPDLDDIPESKTPIDFEYFLNFMKDNVDK